MSSRTLLNAENKTAFCLGILATDILMLQKKLHMDGGILREKCVDVPDEEEIDTKKAELHETL